MRYSRRKPGYNVQIGTENQFILGYSLHRRPADTRCLQPHSEKVEATLGQLPGTVQRFGIDMIEARLRRVPLSSNGPKRAMAAQG